MAAGVHAPSSPARRFRRRTKVLAFRYHGKRPMVGIRVDRVLHVLFIERQFGDLYDHGGS